MSAHIWSQSNLQPLARERKRHGGRSWCTSNSVVAIRWVDWSSRENLSSPTGARDTCQHNITWLTNTHTHTHTHTMCGNLVVGVGSPAGLHDLEVVLGRGELAQPITRHQRRLLQVLYDLHLGLGRAASHWRRISSCWLLRGHHSLHSLLRV